MQKSDWANEIGQIWSQEWQRTDRSFTNLTERLLSAMRGMDGSKVLDIGCGAGELSLAFARGHKRAEVLGLDVSQDLIDVAAERSSNLGNIKFSCADAANWTPDPAFAPNLLMSRHGVMFFDDPKAAFSNLAEIASSNAALVFSCFRTAEENAIFRDVVPLLHLPHEAPQQGIPGPFAFAEPVYVEDVLIKSGWHDVKFEQADFPMILGGGENPIDDAVSYLLKIGPAARAISELNDEDKEAIRDRLANLARQNCHNGLVVLAAAAWIVTAKKS